MAEVEDFVYDSLPQSPGTTSHAIRLLRIHDGPPDTQLRCSLETYSYDACPAYWALSYTWGPEAPSHMILVNDKRFHVRQNLFDFLKSFRSPYNVEFHLWIDQLCINQDNVPERSSQVRRMGEYYSRAICVLTWLGVGTEVELAAMAQVQSIDPAKVPPPKRQQPLSIDLLRGYRSIIANSYFERLWVVQEMARAQDILIMMGKEGYGAETTSWRHFNIAFMQLAFEDTIGSTTAVTAQQEIMLRQEIRDHKILFQLLEVKKYQAAIDIFELIEAFSDFKCADPRDKLFALRDIGHLRKHLFTIDYSKNVHQVYQDFLISCLKSGDTMTSRQFDILSSLARAMGLQVDIQPVPKEAASDSTSHIAQETSRSNTLAPTQVRAQDLEMLKESMEYVAAEDIRIFGPRYDKETGFHVSPFSKKHVQGRIPTIFRVPVSVDLAEMTKMAHENLAQRLGKDREALFGGAEGSEASYDPVPDGYYTITMLSGDVSHWGLPALDTDGN
jgi:hypothetical protein